jgi:hypothetical protein
LAVRSISSLLLRRHRLNMCGPAGCAPRGHGAGHRCAAGTQSSGTWRCGTREPAAR